MFSEQTGKVETSTRPRMSTQEPKSRPRMSTRNRLLFFATGWLIVLMPFLFWWNTWFGRHLSDRQITEYLHDDKKPRHIQQALVQISERMGGGNQAGQNQTQQDQAAR